MHFHIYMKFYFVKHDTFKCMILTPLWGMIHLRVCQYDSKHFQETITNFQIFVCFKNNFIIKKKRETWHGHLRVKDIIGHHEWCSLFHCGLVTPYGVIERGQHSYGVSINEIISYLCQLPSQGDTTTESPSRPSSASIDSIQFRMD